MNLAQNTTLAKNAFFTNAIFLYSVQCWCKHTWATQSALFPFSFITSSIFLVHSIGWMEQNAAITFLASGCSGFQFPLGSTHMDSLAQHAMNFPFLFLTIADNSTALHQFKGFYLALANKKPPKMAKAKSQLLAWKERLKQKCNSSQKGNSNYTKWWCTDFIFPVHHLACFMLNCNNSIEWLVRQEKWFWQKWLLPVLVSKPTTAMAQVPTVWISKFGKTNWWSWCHFAVHAAFCNWFGHAPLLCCCSLKTNQCWW